MEIDIRTHREIVVSTIRVWEFDAAWYIAEVIEQHPGAVRIIDTESSRYLEVMEKEHAQNLIKGIQKAIDLGWFE